MKYLFIVTLITSVASIKTFNGIANATSLVGSISIEKHLEYHLGQILLQVIDGNLNLNHSYMN